MRNVMLAVVSLSAGLGVAHADEWKAWRDCIPNSAAQGGCDSMAPGGGQYAGPGGGLSAGPGGGLSMAPGGGQYMGPGGGQYAGPGGGKSLTRDRSRGLDPDTMRPYPEALPNFAPSSTAPTLSPSTPDLPLASPGMLNQPEPDRPSVQQELAPPLPPNSPVINYSGFDAKTHTIMTSDDPDEVRTTFRVLQQDAQEIIGVRTQYLVELARFQSQGNREAANQQAQRLIAGDAEIHSVQGRIDQMSAVVRKKLATQQ